MDNQHFSDEKRFRQPVGGRNGCILDDIDSVLDEKILRILRRAIKRWEKRSNLESSNHHHVWQTGPSQDEKQIEHKRKMQELDDAIQRLRKDLNLKHTVQNENEQSAKEVDHDYSEVTIGESPERSGKVASDEKDQDDLAERGAQPSFDDQKSSKQLETRLRQSELQQTAHVKVSRKPPIASKNTSPWVSSAPSCAHATNFMEKFHATEEQIASISHQRMTNSDDAPTSNLSASQDHAELRNRMTNVRKAYTGAVQHSAITQDTSPPEVQLRYLQRHARDEVFQDWSRNVSLSSIPTRDVDHKVTASFPPKGCTSADRPRYVPNWKLDFDIKETTPDETSQDVEDKVEDFFLQENPISPVVGVGLSSPLGASEHAAAGKSSKGQWDMNESINRPMFNTNQIRYDAIKVIAEIQMNDLKESFSDWQKKFLENPLQRKMEAM